MEAKAVFCLFWISLQSVSSLEDGADADVDFERLENEYAVGNVSDVTEAYENSTSSQILSSISTETPTTDSSNATEFRPSVHLGEIDEFRSSNTGNPFNKLNHLKFDNFFSAKGAEAWNNVPPKNETNLSKENKDGDKNVHQTTNFFPTTSIPDENQYFRTHDNGAVFPRILPSIQYQNFNPTAFQNSQPLSSSFDRPGFPTNSPDKTYFDTTYVHEVPPPFEYPGSFQEEPNFVTPLNDVGNFEFVKHPGFGNYKEPNFAQVHQEIQEVSPTRNQRFPYKFYHETPTTFHDGNLEYVPEEHVFNNVPRARKMSPWKKIIHLIGTILPFGLLLASLTPNVVQISNSTDGTIPLSKLKNLNLPPEHKSSRMIEDPNICEEKNICELILAGSRPRSNLLQNILWNFVVRTREETAEDNGLRDLFKAVKNKDCNLITC